MHSSSLNTRNRFFQICGIDYSEINNSITTHFSASSVWILQTLTYQFSLSDQISNFCKPKTTNILLKLTHRKKRLSPYKIHIYLYVYDQHDELSWFSNFRWPSVYTRISPLVFEISIEFWNTAGLKIFFLIFNSNHRIAKRKTFLIIYANWDLKKKIA